MKKLIIGLVVILVLMVGLGAYVTSTSFDLYADQEHAVAKDVLDSDVPTVYYYYRPDCHYCTSMKGQVSMLAKVANQRSDIDLKLINTDKAGNEDVLDATAEVSPDITTLTSADDIHFQGTPGMIYVKDGEVKSYGVGQYTFDVLEYANSDMNLGLTFDSSVYGK